MKLSPAYEFENFILIPDEKQLLRDGKRVALTPKAFDTLLMLVENHGGLITKEEFLSKLWPDSFVEEVALAHNISQLRRALRNVSQEVALIETVPKRGYRFVGTVRETTSAALATESAEKANSPISAPPADPVPETGRLLDRSTVETLRQLTRRATVRFAAGIMLLFVVVSWSVLKPGWPKPSVRINSLAVLPLANLSGDPNQEYLSDGLTDELITALAPVPGLRVVSRTSAMQYKNTRKSMPEIGKELNVDAIVEGSVAREGDRVRVRVQLVRASTDEHVWAEAYERSARDMILLQDELAQDITSEIRIKANLPGLASHNLGSAIDPEAHVLYLKGRYFWNKRDQAGLVKAIDFFQQAIEKDPKYAAAYSGLADCYLLLGGYGFISATEALQKAKTAAEHALALDDGLAEAHTSLALISLQLDWNWEEARQQYQRALQLSPGYATAHHWYGDAYLALLGKFDEAVAELRNAQELDPLSPIIITDLGKDLYLARRYDEAIPYFRKALELDPHFSWAHTWLELTLVEKGLYLEALSDLEGQKQSLTPSYFETLSAYAHARAGQVNEARSELRELHALSAREHVDPSFFAMIDIALGNKDKAFYWLDRAVQANSSGMTELRVWPVFDPLRSDPRFHSLLLRTHLTM